jgi:hypothetical protein
MKINEKLGLFLMDEYHYFSVRLRPPLLKLRRGTRLCVSNIRII